MVQGCGRAPRRGGRRTGHRERRPTRATPSARSSSSSGVLRPYSTAWRGERRQPHPVGPRLHPTTPGPGLGEGPRRAGHGELVEAGLANPRRQVTPGIGLRAVARRDEVVQLQPPVQPGTGRRPEERAVVGLTDGEQAAGRNTRRSSVRARTGSVRCWRTWWTCTTSKDSSSRSRRTRRRRRTRHHPPPRPARRPRPTSRSRAPARGRRAGRGHE